MKLTSRNVRSEPLPAGKGEAIFFDDDVPGFGLRVREGGSRSYVFQYKVGAKQRRMALGSVAAVDFGKVRENAKDLYARVRLGEDPAGDKAVSKSKAVETFEATVALYLPRHRASLRPKSYTDLERNLLTYAKVLHGLQLAKIERRDIASCLAAVAKNNGDTTSNRLRTSLSGFFSWAIGEGLTEQNPVIGTNRKDEKARERVLSPAELRSMWTALEDDQFGAIMKLLTLTGQRAGEVAGMRWSEIDLAGRSWLLPSDRTKNQRPHLVPLSDAVHAIIAAQPRRVNRDGKLRDLIFGRGEGPFSGWSNCKGLLDARITEATNNTLRHWVAHDLRRTFATHAAEVLKIQPHIIEVVLNHISGFKAGVAGVYNRATYEPEKRMALDRWAEQLLAWVEGHESNVTPLRRA
jgi:integrase